MKSLKLYHDNGFFNAEYMLNKKEVFSFIIGGRGTGKSYGVLKALIMHEELHPFLYLRRTQSQIDIINMSEFNIFSDVLQNENFDIKIDTFSMGKGVSRYATYREETDDKGKTKKVPEKTICITAALSTFSNLRSVNMQNIQVIFFDECIPEMHERYISYEEEAILNLYETVNRNKELRNVAPVRFICAGNSNNFSAPIIKAFNLENRIYKMMDKGYQYDFQEKTKIGVYFLSNSVISDRKSAGALYSATDKESFKDMALNNHFTNMDSDRIVKSMPLKEYKSVAIFNGIELLYHKSNNTGYIRLKESENYTGKRLKSITAKNSGFVFLYLHDKLFFQNYKALNIFKGVFEIE